MKYIIIIGDVTYQNLATAHELIQQNYKVKLLKSKGVNILLNTGSIICYILS